MFGKERPMNEEFRNLNNAGIEQFKAWIKNGGKGLLPKYLLESTQYSFPTDYAFSTDLPELSNRYELGKYLVKLFDLLRHLEIENDIKFWSSLALIWFDSISSRNVSGDRKIQEMARYILKLDWHDYRHLVRTPWILVRHHGANAKFLLISAKTEGNPLSVTSDTLEKIGSRQALLRNRNIIRVFSKLYFDHDADQLKPRLMGKGPGAPNRTGVIVRQLALTYDLEEMSEQAIYDILPREFDKWKEGALLD